MSVVPAAAADRPFPEEELAVLMLTCGNWAWYAGPHRVNRGAISELPVSDNCCAADAGVVGSAGPLAGGDDGLLAAPPVQAARPSAAARANAVTARGLRPGWRPGGGCASSASNDNVPSLVFQPKQGRQDCPAAHCYAS